MRNNPVYKREMAVRARSPRIPVLIMLFNGILAAAALLNMYSSIVQVRISNTIRYESFVQLYAVVASLEFLRLLFFKAPTFPKTRSSACSRIAQVLYRTKSAPSGESTS